MHLKYVLTVHLSSKITLRKEKEYSFKNLFLILIFVKLVKIGSRRVGAWVAQLAECPTLYFGSGHDLTVYEFEPHIRLRATREEPIWDSFSLSLSLSLSAPPPLACACSLSLKTNLKKGGRA